MSMSKRPTSESDIAEKPLKNGILFYSVIAKLANTIHKGINIIILNDNAATLDIESLPTSYEMSDVTHATQLFWKARRLQRTELPECQKREFRGPFLASHRKVD